MEKEEVPIVASTVSAGLDAPAAAQIEIVPTDSALRILPRTMVHLFYFEASEAQYGTIAYGSKKQSSLSSADGAYRLLFCGEVFDLVYTKTAEGTRTLVLNCLDFSNLWDTTYLYYLRFEPKDSSMESRTIYNGSTANFLGAPELFDDLGFDGPAGFIASRLSAGQTAATPELAGVSNTLGGLLSILEVVGGIHGKTVGLYDWATVEERRVRLLDQIATDSGKTAANLYNQAVLQDWILGRLGDMGEVISFRQIITLVNSYIYYQVAANPVGVYVPGSRVAPFYETSSAVLDPDLVKAIPRIQAEMVALGWDGKSPDRFAAEVSQDIRSADEARAMAAKGEGAGDGSLHTQGMAVDFSAGGIGFRQYGERKIPSDSEEANKDEGSQDKRYRALTALGATGEKKQAVFESVGLWAVAQAVAAQNPGISKQKFYERLNEQIPGSDTRLENVLSFWEDLGTAVATVRAADGIPLKWGGTFKATDPVLRIIAPSMGNDPVHVELDDAKERTNKKVAATAPSETGEARQRLLTQFFRPDVWFVPPPACNVVFPEEISSFSFRRQMMREVTRIELDTFNVMYGDSSGILRQTFFAPVLENTDSLTVGGIGEAKKRIVYPHEIYSGIIPKIERMSDVSFYSKLSEIYGGVGPDSQTDDEPASQIERLAARAALFHFLSYRFGARTISATCKFLPRMVVGFPAVFIDRPPAAGNRNPTHFLGMVESVQHSLGQGGGQTFVSCSHARSHKTSKDDLDDLFSRRLYDGGQLFSAQISEGSKTTEIDVEQILKKNPQFFELAALGILSDATTEILLFMLNKTKDLPAEQLPLRYTGADVEALKGPSGQKVLALERKGTPPTGGPLFDAGFKFTGIRVTEGAKDLLPLEEALRPAWFSDEYSNANIGEHIYQKFLGTDSILERTGETTIEKAVDAIVDAYGKISNNGPVPGYIWFTTYRPGASLPDVLGRGSGSKSPEAFHYYAGGDFTKLEKLDLVDGANEKGQPISLVSPVTEDARTVDPAIDPRRGRWQVARSYVVELAGQRAFRG